MSAEPLTETRVHLDRSGFSADEAVAFYECVYASDDIAMGSPDPDFSWRYRIVGDEDMVIGTSQVGARRWGSLDTRGDYVLAWATGAGIVLDSDTDDPVSMRPGVPVMYPSGRPFQFDAEAGTQHLIRFEGRFLEAVAAARHGDVPGPLTFAPDPDRVALQRLRRVVQGVAPELLRSSTESASRSILNMAVAEAVVAAFDATPAPDAGDRPSSVRFAQEWIVAHARRPMTVSEVARATGVGVRSLQSAFQRHAGMTPMEFLRETRIHRVRAELLAADPARSTVAEIAAAWGFGHLGRFAGTYSATFGEKPSATLRRAR
jgi:AraC-like DNA-binding protein